MTPDADDFAAWLRYISTTQSRSVENVIEHLFLAEILRECWFRRRQPVAVSRAEVDSDGYDVVLESLGQIRYIQLKASIKGGKTSKQTINAKLENRPGGCIVWVNYEPDRETGNVILTYRWREAEGLPADLGRHTRTGRERPTARVVRRGDFETLTDTRALVDRLFSTRR